jgi:lipopolysaccharide transport system ATP-binding protein
MSSDTLDIPRPVTRRRGSRGDVVIRARAVGKAYTIACNGERHSTLAEALLHRVRHPLARAAREQFWALRDISFDVRRGDVVGIIGRNGAGKSTLLKVLSRITEPTRGGVDLYGRVGSLLEVGTGFHPELTGRENIFLNGQILGMRRREIDQQFDAIVDFAGCARFLETPVKRYSSGMYVRLAFAVAAHLNPEVLIVDEVLAVGDVEFQKKCLGKMEDVAQGGRTVLFVSHNMAAVRQLCKSSLVLENGRIAFAGGVDAGIARYLSGETNGSTTNFSLRHAHPSLTLVSASVDDPSLRYGGPLRVQTVWEAKEAMQVALEVVLKDNHQTPLAFYGTGISSGYEMRLRPGTNKVTIEYPALPLAEGRFFLDVAASKTNQMFYVYAENAVAVDVVESDPMETGLRYTQGNGSVFIPCGVTTGCEQVRITMNG